MFAFPGIETHLIEDFFFSFAKERQSMCLHRLHIHLPMVLSTLNVERECSLQSYIHGEIQSNFAEITQVLKSFTEVRNRIQVTQPRPKQKGIGKSYTLHSARQWGFGQLSYIQPQSRSVAHVVSSSVVMLQESK